MNRLLGVVLILAVAIWWWLLSQFDPAQRFTLFFINKSLADTSVVVMGISFVIGPLCKLIPSLARVIRIRKYFGVVGFGLGVAHILTTLLQWNARFPLSYYVSHLWGIIAGVVATGIFIVMTRSSGSAAFQRLGEKRWKQIQRLGYISLFLLMIHLTVVSGARWQQWWSGKVAMPNSALVAVTIIIVLLVRGAALVIDQLFPVKKSRSTAR